MPQHPNVKSKSSGSHLDQHPAVKTKKSGSHLDQNPNVKKGKSGSHLEQHPAVQARAAKGSGSLYGAGPDSGDPTSSGDHLTPVRSQAANPRTSERGGHSRKGHVRSKPATNPKAGPKHVASRIV